MSVSSRLLAVAFRLPPAASRHVTVTADLPVPTVDGVVLRTDHYAPATGAGPAILIRTPYGRRGPWAAISRVFAERGFHVVIQSCRGTFGSTGTFEPLRHERADGLSTVEWMRAQPWYTGEFGTFGPSYLGYVQWAIATEAGDELKAMVAVVTAAQTRDSTYSGGSFSLDTVLTWAELLQAQGTRWWVRQIEMRWGQPRRLRRALDHLPLVEADRIATGRTIPFFQDWLAHAGEGAEYWRPRVFHERIAEVKAPVALVTGWHDIFLPDQLNDYAALRAAGAEPQLTIGPWTHGSVGLYRAALHEGLRWFGAHLRGDRSGLREAPVRVHVGHAGWRDLAAWPPPSASTPWHLQPAAGLAPGPAPSTSERFRYDPADPTPSLGGPLLAANRAGPVDNRPVEARPDVLVYTSEPLRTPVDILGPVEAAVHVRSEVPHFDVFVRLCDVDSAGRSRNVCDGLTRVTQDGRGVVRVPMWPAGHRFRPGHRIRLQVSGGAHPRYARNTGSGEPLATATTLRAGWREVWHDSAVLLPVTDRTGW